MENLKYIKDYEKVIKYAVNFRGEYFYHPDDDSEPPVNLNPHHIFASTENLSGSYLSEQEKEEVKQAKREYANYVNDTLNMPKFREFILGFNPGHQVTRTSWSATDGVSPVFRASPLHTDEDGFPTHYHVQVHVPVHPNEEHEKIIHGELDSEDTHSLAREFRNNNLVNIINT